MSVLGKTLKKAIKKLEKESLLSAKNDKYRLNYHLMPPIGWLNDPNGLCYYNNEYNIFFQYSPFEVNGELKFWGHYKTKDLINYRYIGVSVYPDEKYDCHGAFSGSAFIENNKMYIYYTGNIELRGDYDYVNEGRESNTILITSNDGINFDNKKCIMEMKDYPDGITNHIRDPKVWKEGNMYYMVQGVRRNTKPNNKGAVIIFTSEDKVHWKYLSMINSKEDFAYMWECPDLFKLDGQYILITCPQGVKRVESLYENIYLNGYFIVPEDNFKNDITVDKFFILDKGFDFYAPQTFIDENNDRVMIGWMGLPDIDEEYKNNTETWQHCLTIARTLSFKNNRVYQTPHKSLEKLRRDTLSIEDIKNNNIDSYEVLIDIKDSKDLQVVISEGLFIKHQNNKFILEFMGDIGKTIGCGRTKRSVELNTIYNLRIFVDTSSVEVFINDGSDVFTTRYYPLSQSLKIKGDVSYTIYQLDSFAIQVEN
ncbi:glycosyl hydrolase family 32 [Campylobacter estrildidarum]|uniref:Sucrose-6-phosphate hydrolase n=1 Tax=Campylobacter estrildidarum TaxID=2510189 RepID=A0A4U7BFR8_9BACT|nr:glycosyl hydrolase family 32 [Campylobacter estrildidarum]